MSQGVSTKSRRVRLTPDESRLAALEAARLLLIESGPQAVTLKAVGAKIGRTHANLLHHFGSALELQKALARHICARISDIIQASIVNFYQGQPVEDTAQQIAHLTFDAFDSEGAGQIATWMIQTGQEDAFASIVDAVVELVTQLHAQKVKSEGLSKVTHKLVLLALGDSMIGPQLAQSLGLERTTGREMATAFLIRHLRELRAATVHPEAAAHGTNGQHAAH